MSIIGQVKADHKESRLQRNKELAKTLTMLISRADADRVKYGLKSTDELTDEQMLKILSAEKKQLQQELSYLSGPAASAVEISISQLDAYSPRELSEEETLALINQSEALNGASNMGQAMKTFNAYLGEQDIKGTVRMDIVAKLIKGGLNK